MGRHITDVEALHLNIDQTRESGSSHNIHALENGDLSVIRTSGRENRHQIPADEAEASVLVASSVDNDDEVPD